MIPKKLQIKNFLSYGPDTQTIDFLSYNLICLSGKNGHGKSALLDAITWALWGQARKTTGTSKADDGLVHLGQKHMLVTFDFDINGISYRVRREFVKTKSHPFSALDFGITKPDETFTTLTDKTIKATQAKLEKTIGISYESFVNSAFLRQGQANEFSKKSPKERKDILATILQLERFEDLKKVALEKSKTFQVQLLQRQSINNRINDEIIDLEEQLKDLDVHTHQLKDIQEEEKNISQSIIEHDQQKEFLTGLHKKYEFILLQKNQLDKQIGELQNELVILEKTHKDIAEQQKNNTDITALQEEQKQLRASVATHQEKLNKRLELKDQYLNLQEKKQLLEKELHHEKIDIIQKNEITCKILQEQIDQHQRQLQQQEKNLNDLIAETSKQELLIAANTKTIQEHTTKLTGYSQHEKDFELHKNQYQALKTKNTLLEQELIDINQKHKLSLDNQDPSCPLCEQNLSASRKKFLEQKFHQSTTAKQDELQKIKIEAAHLTKILVQENATLQLYKKDNDELTKVISHNDALQEHLKKLHAKITNDQQQIILTKKTISEITAQLSKNVIASKNIESFVTNNEKEFAYQTFIKKIDVLKQTAQTLAYNKELHDTDYKRLQEVETVLATYQNLQKEIAQQDQRIEQIEKLKLHITKIKNDQALLDKDLNEVKDTPKNLNEHLTKEHELKLLAQSIASQKSDLLNKKAVFDLQQKKKITLKQEQICIEKDLKTLNLELADFTEIVKALGKDGLQALLIEQALPEIEQEANILLAQLTDNQTQIFIESLRDLKKGGSKETLDIKISDSIGLRPYEMFSGGEAFRIDFSLRIAISKLLARRAGTALQTLIIDEGFGSQDDDGLQLIMDSIIKIQDNFAKVIIVSHLPSMKEQFPVQFLVQKKASGSVVTVIEQG